MARESLEYDWKYSYLYLQSSRAISFLFLFLPKRNATAPYLFISCYTENWIYHTVCVFHVMRQLRYEYRVSV